MADLGCYFSNIFIRLVTSSRNKVNTLHKSSKAMIAVFAVLLMLASAVIIMIPNDSEAAPDFSKNTVPGSPATYSDARLWILGNANGDMVIDASDKTVINAAVTQGATKAQAPMCDANNDGNITSADADFVQSLIDGSATFVYYYNVDGKVAKFDVKSNIKIVAIHRCVVRSTTVLANCTDDKVNVVAMDSTPFKEVEFNVSVNYPGCIDAGDYKQWSSETIATQVSTIGGDPSQIVYCVGTEDYYLKDQLESWATTYGAQVIRIPTWEHHPTEGILTTAYLFSGVGATNTRADDTCWHHALKYGDWAFGYIDKIEAESSKIAEGDRLKVLGVYTTTKNYEHKNQTRGPGSGDHENFITCGGNSIATRFGDKSAVDWTMENLATYCTDLDILVLMGANCFSKTEFDLNEDAKELTEIVDGYVKKGCKVYAMTWALNGAPFVVQLAYYSKILMPDNSALNDLNPDTVWAEYKELIGWDKRTDISLPTKMVYSDPSNPGVTKTGDDNGGSINMGLVAGIAVGVVAVIAILGFVFLRKR